MQSRSQLPEGATNFLSGKHPPATHDESPVRWLAIPFANCVPKVMTSRNLALSPYDKALYSWQFPSDQHGGQPWIHSYMYKMWRQYTFLYYLASGDIWEFKENSKRHRNPSRIASQGRQRSKNSGIARPGNWLHRQSLLIMTRTSPTLAALPARSRRHTITIMYLFFLLYTITYQFTFPLSITSKRYTAPNSGAISNDSELILSI